MGGTLKLDSGDKRARFEFANNEKGRHHHLTCTKCNRIIDYTDFIDEEVKLLRETEKRLSNEITGIDGCAGPESTCYYTGLFDPETIKKVRCRKYTGKSRRYRMHSPYGQLNNEKQRG